MRAGVFRQAKRVIAGDVAVLEARHLFLKELGMAGPDRHAIFHRVRQVDEDFTHGHLTFGFGTMATMATISTPMMTNRAPA